MEIQQHDGVVVDVAGLRRATPSFCERERGVAGEEGGAQGCCVLPSPLYIGPLGGGRRPRTHLWGGGGQGGGTSPQVKWGAPPPP